jgi:hypothetical protein
MTEEAFWKRIEEEVMPHIRTHHPKYVRFFEEKLEKTKSVNFLTHNDLAHHTWMTLACYLRNFYYEGLQTKTLIEHCCNVCNEPYERFAF